MKIASTLILVLFFSLCANAVQQDGDALDDALKLVGMKRADLGWSPRAWWPRWPEAPYKLRAFDTLFNAPLDTISYTRTLAEAACTMLDPATIDKDLGRNSTALYQAVQRLGVDPKFGGFRGYTANCLAEPTPLDSAILKLIEISGRPTNINTFGMKLPYPQPKEYLAEKVKVIPTDVSLILGKLVLNIMDAHHFAELAFRRVDSNIRIKVATRYDVGLEMIDAYDYIPEIDDMAADIDEASLWYAGQKCVQAIELARIELTKLKLNDIPDFVFDWETPWGWIRIRGKGKHNVNGDDALLIVDLGGNDNYIGGVAASTSTHLINLVLDMQGDDTYKSDKPSQGAGLCGVGVLIDAKGNDTYTAEHNSQGLGQFGLGLLADLEGDDDYFTKFSGQGCGYFGIGLLFDVDGNDNYKLYADGQGLGGVSGVGVLADRKGDDNYIAVRQHTVTGRPSYHSPGLDVCVSNAQGCGMGRRGDGSDGHSWAGGLGALLDSEGNDVYRSGNWSMGTGYWFGIGLLHDRSGNDEYHGVAYTQGTGAHFCIGALIDEEGDDKHLAEENSRCSISWAHDFTISILLDVKGDDLYRIETDGLACSINRSVALLLDLNGNDTYHPQKDRKPGLAKNDPKFRKRSGVSAYFAETTSCALFLDICGSDSYWGDIKNNSHWLDPKDSPNWNDRNFSIGIDIERGEVDFTPPPVKTPSCPK